VVGGEGNSGVRSQVSGARREEIHRREREERGERRRRGRRPSGFARINGGNGVFCPISGREKIHHSAAVAIQAMAHMGRGESKKGAKEQVSGAGFQGPEIYLETRFKPRMDADEFDGGRTSRRGRALPPPESSPIKWEVSS
jgi:hypothetical protein